MVTLKKLSGRVWMLEKVLNILKMLSNINLNQSKITEIFEQCQLVAYLRTHTEKLNKTKLK